MKIEVVCSGCSAAYLLDAELAGTTLPCPSCGAPDGLDVPTPLAPAPAPAAPTPRPASHSPTGTSRSPRPNAGTVVPGPIASGTPVPAREIAVAEEPEEVVCPRCKLHFVPRRATAEAEQAGRRTVLVVEDMDYFREVATEALSSVFEVRQAATLEEARVRLADGDVDLMLLDLTLGGGNTALDFLRSLTVKPCPIVIYADQDESEMYGDSWDELQGLGADDIVIKGMNAGESLARKVASLLGIDLDEDR